MNWKIVAIPSPILNGKTQTDTERVVAMVKVQKMSGPWEQIYICIYLEVGARPHRSDHKIWAQEISKIPMWELQGELRWHGLSIVCIMVYILYMGQKSQHNIRINFCETLF